MKTIIVLSGGLDSTVLLAQARKENKECLALSFDYGQRHKVELLSAQAICKHYQVSQKTLTIDSHIFGDSALINGPHLPRNRRTEEITHGNPTFTYVPARNTIFLAYAMGFAEVFSANEIYFGANLYDQGGFPDCRPAFVQAFQSLMNLATKEAIEGKFTKLITPLIHLRKKEIVELGLELKAPLEMTLSCYDPPSRKEHCGICDACTLRKEGFRSAGVTDPSIYIN